MVDSRAQIKILRYLLEKEGASKTELRRKLYIDHHYIGVHLAKLRDEGLVREHYHGERGIFVMLNKESPKYEAIKTLWGGEES